MSEEERRKLWLEYSKKKTAEVRERIIIEYASLVKIVAGRLSMYLGYTVEYDDLLGYGTFGLIDAIDKFDYQKGVKCNSGSDQTSGLDSSDTASKTKKTGTSLSQN